MHKLTVKTFLMGTSRLTLGSLIMISLMLIAPRIYSDDNIPQTEIPQTEESTDQPQTPTEAPVPEPESATATSETVKKNPNVTRAILTTAIVDKEPTDEIVSIDKNQERIYFFTEFANLKGKVIKHRWEYQGKIMAEVNFNIGSSQWRCYSSKNILPEWTGVWTVSVIDDENQVLAETYFEVTN